MVENEKCRKLRKNYLIETLSLNFPYFCSDISPMRIIFTYLQFNFTTMYGIITLPLVPLRESDNERSELLSQLLFGECIEIIETREHWLFVRNMSDSYRGWLDRKMIQILTVLDEERIANTPKYYVRVPILVCNETTSNAKMFLPGGSILQSDCKDRFTIENNTYSINLSELYQNEKVTGKKITETAFQYLNAPYLWGGKSIFGIDCSGLVQVVYSMFGIQMLRDASDQVESGEVIDFISETKAGDLAFFENQDGRIVHVGILLNSHQIIHSSGCVKIESIDSQGIISEQTGKYTHKLRVVKRVLLS